MASYLIIRDENPVSLQGFIDAMGDLQLSHENDSLAKYGQALEVIHGDLERPDDTLRIKLMDFADGPTTWCLAATHLGEHGSKLWLRGQDHAYFDFPATSSALELEVTATSDESPAQVKQRSIELRLKPVDGLADRPWVAGEVERGELRPFRRPSGARTSAASEPARARGAVNQEPGLLEVQGEIVGVAFTPGDESVTLRTEQGMLQCRASAEQVEQAIDLHRSRAKVEARVVHGKAGARLLSVRDSADLRPVRDEAERSEFLLNRWHDLLVELAK